MAFNPAKIIQDKTSSLVNTAGTVIGEIENIDFSPITNGANAAFQNFGTQIKVLENQFANGDIQGQLSNAVGQIPSAFNSLKTSLAEGQFDLSNIFPPSLNQFANGLGALGNNVEGIVQNILPGSISSLTGAVNSAVADINNQLLGVANGYVTPLTTTGALLTEQQQQSQIGATSRQEVYPAGPGVVLKNQLEAYHSYNCIFTLGVLSSASVNDPAQTYRRNGADFTILRSGGGGIDSKRIQTAYDGMGSEAGNLEYFIDDFEMDSLVSANKQTGMTQAMQFTFKVHEPYSMGIFLQSLQAAAFSAGFQNYLQAPYMLEIDFVGWNDNGEREPIQFSNRKIPFKLISIDFDVEKGGSTYNVKCIPWNEAALLNEIMNLQDSVEITGSTVFESLATGEQSLATTLNNKLQEVARAAGMPASDFYLIRFPSQRTSGGLNASETAGQNSATLTERETVASRLGQEVSDQAGANITQFFASIGLDSNSSNMLNVLKGSAIDDLNNIGAAAMLENINAGGDSPFGLGLYTYDKDKEVYVRDGIELTISGTNRTFKFQQGTPITKVIEEMILVSTYGSYAMNNVNNEGNIPWFHIEPKVYIVDNPDFENVTGKTAKIYVYDVVRHDVNVSQFSAPNKTPVGNVELARQVVKSYNYIYSGKNTDVLGFDIKFNAAFFEAIRSDMNQLGGSQQTRNQDSSVASNPDAVQTVDNTPGNVPSGQTQAVPNVGFTSNNFNASAATNLARNFHNTLLNSDVDLITAEIEIWGDPYYVPDSGVGNYTAGQGPSVNITADGSIDYQRSEVDIIINFRTPIDYSTGTGLMEFPGDTIPVDSFSGLYKILKITSTISGNKFTQRLKLVRRKNQSTEGISTTQIVTERPDAQSLNPNERPLAERIGRDPSERTTPGASAAIQRPIGENGELVTIRTKSGKTTQVAKIVAPQFQALIDELEDFYGYEIRTLGGYADRNARGSSRPSYHASGLAIDINAAENAMVRPRPAPYPNNEPTDMPEAGSGSEMKALAEKHGLGWGGAWNSSIDAMHFSAASAEFGTLDWPRNGLVPKAPDQEEAEAVYDDAILRQARTPVTPPQAQTNTNAGTRVDLDDPRGQDQRGVQQPTIQPVEPRNSLPPSEHARWDARYGQTHNPDGTPRTAAQQTQQARPTVSGTQPVTQPGTPYTNSNQTAGGGYGDILRPYLPTNPEDNLYKFNSGDKIKALARFYTPNYTATSTPTSGSGTTGTTQTFYNDFGDPYTQADADNVEDLRSFNDSLGGGGASSQLTAGERAYAVSRGYI
jgi:hypothetical protein